MLLAVDIGNSNIKFGVYDDDKLTAKLSIPTIRDITPEALVRVAAPKLAGKITASMISSVVPEVDAAMRGFVESHFGVAAVFVQNNFDFGLKVNYEPLADAGSDRLVHAYAAVEKYGAPCIVCSFGTALTIDAVNADRTLLGGVIAPGMNTLVSALKLTTSKLPEVAIEVTKTTIQTTTSGSIQSGVVHGYFGLVDRLLEQVKKEMDPDPKVVATGGFAALVAENTSHINVISYNLLLDGLQMLHRRRTNSR